MNVTQSMVDISILEEILTFLGSIMAHISASDKRSPLHPADRKSESTLASVKRQRHSNDPDEPAHPALSGHDYSQKFVLRNSFVLI